MIEHSAGAVAGILGLHSEAALARVDLCANVVRWQPREQLDFLRVLDQLGGDVQQLKGAGIQLLQLQ